MTKKAKTNAERQRDFKARKKAQGLREVQEFGIWVTESQWQYRNHGPAFTGPYEF